MIKPLQDYVVLQNQKVEKKVGSIILTSDNNKPNVATIVAVGPGVTDKDGKLITINLTVGQKVLYKQYSTTEYKEGDDKYLLVKAEDIIAIIE